VNFSYGTETTDHPRYYLQITAFISQFKTCPFYEFIQKENKYDTCWHWLTKQKTDVLHRYQVMIKHRSVHYYTPEHTTLVIYK